MQLGQFLLSGLLLTTLILAGCNTQPENAANSPTDATVATLPEKAETNAPVPADTYVGTGGALGTEQPAGPFTVTLTTKPSPPQIGDNAWTVQVRKDGQPVKGAEVNITFVDPATGAKADVFQLTDTGGEYSAAQNLNTKGKIQAHVTAVANNQSGRAIYTIDIPG